MCKWLEHEIGQEQIGMQRIIMHCPSRFVEDGRETDNNVYHLTFWHQSFTFKF
jgi:hypothetical protein